MSTSINAKLLEFFKWWLQESTSPTPNYEITRYGLCFLMGRYLEQYNYPEWYGDKYIQGITKDIFPFNRSHLDFEQEKYNKCMHLNPERIAFVKSQIERLEKLQSANQE